MVYASYFHFLLHRYLYQLLADASSNHFFCRQLCTSFILNLIYRQQLISIHANHRAPSALQTIPGSHRASYLNRESLNNLQDHRFICNIYFHTAISFSNLFDLVFIDDMRAINAIETTFIYNRTGTPSLYSPCGRIIALTFRSFKSITFPFVLASAYDSCTFPSCTHRDAAWDASSREECYLPRPAIFR